MEVYWVQENDLTRVPQTSLDEELTLENYLLKAEGAEIGSVDLLYFSRQERPSHGGYYDIGALDSDGNVVVVELKRDRTPRKTITQALDYVSGIRNEDYSDLNETYQTFLSKSGTGSTGAEDAELAEAHAAYFGLDEPLSEHQFNTDQRFVIVGTEFGDTLLNMADFLREHGIDVMCVEYRAFVTDDGEVELLTTDGIRRPLSEEPDSHSTSPERADYSDFSRKVRERVFPEIRDTVSAENSDDIFGGTLSRRLYVRSNDPSHPTNLGYLMAPRFDEWGGVDLQVNVKGGGKETQERLQRIVADRAGKLKESGFEVNSDGLLGLVKKRLHFDVEEPDEQVIDEVASEYATMIEMVHPEVLEVESE